MTKFPKWGFKEVGYGLLTKANLDLSYCRRALGVETELKPAG